MTSRQRLRELVKESCELSLRIDEEEYAPLLHNISRITKENLAIQPQENNALMLKSGITRITNASFLNVLETKRNSVFNENDLVRALVNSVREEGVEEVEVVEDAEPIWSNLVSTALSCFKTVYLPFPVQLAHDRAQEPEKVKAARARRSTIAPGRVTVAEKLAAFDKDNARALESVYQDIIQAYVDEGQQPMPFYKLICDPSSFTKSVHNAFQLSFLIQSNLVRVFKSEGGETLLEPLDMNAPFTSQKGGDNSVHAVISMDYELWEQSVNDYQVNRSQISA